MVHMKGALVKVHIQSRSTPALATLELHTMNTPIEAIKAKHQKVVDGFISGKTLPLDYRKDQLRKLYFAIKDNQDALKDAHFKDLHRSRPEIDTLELFAVYGEITTAIAHLSEWAADTKLTGDERLKSANPVLRKTPYGAVLVMAPWNYPYVLSLAPICNAIAAGNTVVYKPSEISQHSTKVLTEVLEAALDPETFQVVLGGPEESIALLELKFDKIMFTGSTPVGKIVAVAAAKQLTPVTLELGGKSPVIVTEKANLALSAKRIAWGKFTNAGQTCIAPDYVLVEKAIADEFVAEFTKAVKEMWGSELDKDSNFGHIISSRLWERQQKLVAETKGTIALQIGTADSESLFSPPTVVTGVTPDDILMTDELFGPVLPIMTIDSLKDAPALIRHHDYPLALYLFSDDAAEHEWILQHVRAGAVVMNDTLIHAGSEAVPFGGVGSSGMGRYHGKFGFDEFTHELPVIYQTEEAEQIMSVRYPPISDDTMTKLRSLAEAKEWFPRTGPIPESPAK